MTSAIISIFMAQYLLFVWSRHKHTRPNVPVPIFRKLNEEEKERKKRKGQKKMNLVYLDPFVVGRFKFMMF